MDKPTLIAVLRSEAQLTLIQAHNAFYMLQQAELLQKVSPSGSLVAVKEPQIPLSWNEIIKQTIPDSKFAEQFLAKTSADNAEIGQESFKKLLDVYIDLKRSTESCAQQFAAKEYGSTFTDIRSLPFWYLQLEESLTFNTVASSVFTQQDFAALDAEGGSLTLGYPIEIKQGNIIPIFLVRINKFKSKRYQQDLVTFEEDLLPQLNDAWLNEHYSGRAEKEKEKFIAACSIYADEFGKLNSDGLARDFYNPDSWGQLCTALAHFHSTAQKLDYRHLNKYETYLKDGIYNIAVIGRPADSPYVKSLINDLENLKTADPALYKDTVLPYLFFSRIEPQPLYPELVFTDEKLPFNAEQRLAVASMLRNKLTVLQGPPGTGKTQVIAAAALNAAAEGKSVLITSFNHQAITALMERFDKVEHAAEIAVRANDKGSTDVTLYQAYNELEQNELFDAEDASKQKFLNECAESVKQLEHLDKIRALFSRQQELERKLKTLLSGSQVLENSFNSIIKKNLNSRSSQELKQFLKDIKDFYKAAFAAADIKELSCWQRFKNWRQYKGICRKYGSELTKLLCSKDSSLSLRTAYVDLLSLLSSAAEVKEELNQDEEPEVLHNNIKQNLERIYSGAYRKSLSRCAEAAANKSPSEERWNQYLHFIKKYGSADAAEKNDINAQILTDDVFRTNFSAELKRILKHKPIWLCSTASIRRLFPFAAGMFDLVIFDESSQFDFISALPVMYRAKSAAVVGDPEQIGPILRGLGMGKQEWIFRKNGLQAAAVPSRFMLRNPVPICGQDCNSLYNFAKSVPGGQYISLLESYRSCREITDFISKLSYKGSLVSKRDSADLPLPCGFAYGIKWIDVPDNTQPVKRSHSTSRINESEAQAVAEQLRRIYADSSFTGSVGVIAAYSVQAALIYSKVQADPELAAHLQEDPSVNPESLFITTVHKAQGSERDVIVLSLCLSSKMGNRFVGEAKNLLNVAVSRARSLVLVVSNAEAAALTDAEFIRELAAAGGAVQDVLTEPRLVDPETEKKFESPLERLLYQHLVKLGLNPIPQYKVLTYNRRLDFALIDPENKLYLDIEVDGSCHLDSLGRRKQDDYLRDSQMKSLNFQIIRFWGREVYRSPAECALKVREIWQQMHERN